MRRRTTSRILAAATTTLLAAGLVVAVPAGAAAPAAGQGFTATQLSPDGEAVAVAKSRSGQLAESDPELLASTSSASVPIMVKLDYDAVAAYQGGVEGLAPTSPQETGRSLAEPDAAVQEYRAFADDQNATATAAIEQAVPSATVGQAFDLVYGGLAVTLPEADAKKLLAVPGVVAVQRDTLNQLQQASATAVTAADTLGNDATSFIGADKVWAQLGGQALAGSGVIVGVLDSGIWPEHPMLSPGSLPAPPGGLRGCEFGGGADPALGPDFVCNNKLIGAYAFMDTSISQEVLVDGEYCTADTCSARDSDGHGTHTATTAAGSPVASAPIFGVDRGPISGVAPGAHVIAYRVCGTGGCYGSDSVAAVQQAILDDVDVINFSISGGESAYTDPVELAFLDAYAAGVSVNASAGNDGPDAATANHAGPWVTTVAASTSNREFGTTLTLTGGAGFSKAGVSVTAPLTTPTAVILATAAPGYTGTEFCDVPFPAGSLTGKVVVCVRGGGGGGRVEKGYFAQQAGAAGMILLNPTAQSTNTDNHFLPTIHLEGPNADVLAFIAANPGTLASWPASTVTPTQGDVMAGFSSRGPLGDFIKPDLTAPGVQVLAGTTPTPVELPSGPAGQLYMAIAGTSMSSPHSAGVSALVKAVHPDWTPGQIKSALMTSTLQSVTNSDGSAANLWDRGAGTLRADRAVKPTLTLDVAAADYVASAADPLHRVDLNLASINVDPLPGAQVVKRTVTNVSDRTETISASTTITGGAKLTAIPSKFTLRSGQSRTVSFLIDGVTAADGWQTGQITLAAARAGSIPVVMPVAVNIGDADVTLTHTCDPTTINRLKTTTCTVTAANLAPVPAKVDLLVASGFGLPITQVSAPARRILLGATWSGTLTPALAPPIQSIAPTTTSPGEGYLGLAQFGIAPNAGMRQDEVYTNYNVPSFSYGGEVYNRIGIFSNGYVVVGGGAAADNNCCNLTDFPNAARPNNVLAPFWTDLDLSADGTNVRVGSLTGGGTSWLVIEYENARRYGGGTPTSFQTWIQLGATEGIWYEYGAVGQPSSDGLIIGAENRDGSSGVNLGGAPVVGTSYLVDAGTPIPGGTASFTYKATGVLKGAQPLIATLKSPVVRSFPVEKVTVTVK